MSKDQVIRETAYAIWETEGRPDGQNEEHWARAETLVNDQPTEPLIVKKSGGKKTPAIVDPVISVGGD